jgi:serine/threonine-protein kinase RsbW
VTADVESGSNEASVTVVNGPLAGPVLGRVVGMLAARADCPIDRLDDALLVADAVAAKAASFSDDGRVNVLVGPLRPDGADDLVESAELPGVGNVLERVADEIESKHRDGEDGPEYLRIRLGFDVQRPSMIDRMGSDAS